MALKIQTEQFAAAIADCLKTYTKEVEAEIEKAIDEVSEDCAKELRATSPKRTGRYAKGWRVHKDGQNKRVVWNKDRYMLVHLLEKGHAKRGGGRVPGKAHVAPAEAKYIKQLEERVKKAIERG